MRIETITSLVSLDSPFLRQLHIPAVLLFNSCVLPHVTWWEFNSDHKIEKFYEIKLCFSSLCLLLYRIDLLILWHIDFHHKISLSALQNKMCTEGYNSFLVNINLDVVKWSTLFIIKKGFLISHLWHIRKDSWPFRGQLYRIGCTYMQLSCLKSMKAIKTAGAPTCYTFMLYPILSLICPICLRWETPINLYCTFCKRFIKQVISLLNAVLVPIYSMEPRTTALWMFCIQLHK